MTGVQERYLELHEIYGETQKASILREAEALILAGNTDAAGVVLEKLEDKKQLLAKLEQHLKGKPVHKTLMRWIAGEPVGRYTVLKALFSLGAHISIELERGNLEYRALLDEVMGNIYKAMDKRNEDL